MNNTPRPPSKRPRVAPRKQPAARRAVQLLRDEVGAVTVEYLVALAVLFLVTASALAYIAVRLFGHYAAAPILLQTGNP